MSLRIALFLMMWYLIQLGGFLYLGSPDAYQYWFVATSLTNPTPGLLFAVFTHELAVPISKHLVGNVLLLLIFGSLSEKHIGAYRLLSLFLITGLSQIVLTVQIRRIIGESPAIVGASGAIFAIMSFYCIHLAARHRGRVRHLGRRFLDGNIIDGWLLAFITLIPAAALVQNLGGLLNVIDIGKSDGMGHLIGLGIGVICALAYSALNLDCKAGERNS